MEARAHVAASQIAAKEAEAPAPPPPPPPRSRQRPSPPPTHGAARSTQPSARPSAPAPAAPAPAAADPAPVAAAKAAPPPPRTAAPSAASGERRHRHPQRDPDQGAQVRRGMADASRALVTFGSGRRRPQDQRHGPRRERPQGAPVPQDRVRPGPGPAVLERQLLGRGHRSTAVTARSLPAERPLLPSPGVNASDAGSPVSAARDPREARVVVIVFFTVFLDLVGFGIIIPFLPLYVKSMGGTAETVGFLFASVSATQLVATPLLGRVSIASVAAG